MSSRVVAVTDEVVRDGEREAFARDDIRGRVDRKVGEEIARETNQTGEEQEEIERVARDMKAKSVDGLKRSERELGTGRVLNRIYSDPPRRRGVVRRALGPGPSALGPRPSAERASGLSS